MTGNTPNTPESLQLMLTEGDSLGRISVSLEAFFDFSFELAEDLEDLVAQWQHCAAPSAQPSPHIFNR